MLLGIPFLDKLQNKFKSQVLDDGVDRLNYRTAALIVLFFALMVSAKQYTGKPIQCWTPSEFNGAWVDYAHDYCFTADTYFVKDNETDSLDSADRGKDSRISYYQWVPLLLAIQALCFYLPNWLWKTTTSYFGIDLEHCVTAAVKARTANSEKRQKELGDVSITLAEALGLQDYSKFRRRDRSFKFGADYLSNSLTSFYIFIKALYVVNLICQIHVISAFLSSDHVFWGFSTLANLVQGLEWETTGLFPRVTFCDFYIHTHHSLANYTVQCVLMINMFNEKIFLFLWFLFMLMLIVTSINAVATVFSYTVDRCREKSVYKWLKHAPEFDPIHLSRFSKDVLKADGCLVLRFIEDHAGLAVARDVASKLWSEWISETGDSTMLSLKHRKPSDQYQMNSMENNLLHKSAGTGLCPYTADMLSKKHLDAASESTFSTSQESAL
ncbi:unnamed protein product, partial [Mesorhabditis spiculigera]